MCILFSYQYAFSLLAIGKRSNAVNQKNVILTFILQIDIMNISWYISLMWVPQNLFPISQLYFKKWLDAIRQQATTWANVDPDLSWQGVARPQWVNYISVTLRCDIKLCHHILREGFVPFGASIQTKIVLLFNKSIKNWVSCVSGFYYKMSCDTSSTCLVNKRPKILTDSFQSFM